MVGFLLWDPYFFRYDNKLLGLGINEQVMSFQNMCQLTGATTASTGAVAAFARAVATSVGAVVGIFG